MDCGSRRVNGLTRAAAHALGFYGINVNAVARGNTARKPYNAGVLERVRRLPLGRTETAEDMVEPCVFLASDGSSYVTGTILYVDGGYTVAGVTDDRYRPEWARAGAERKIASSFRESDFSILLQSHRIDVMSSEAKHLDSQEDNKDEILQRSLSREHRRASNDITFSSTNTFSENISLIASFLSVTPTISA